MKKILFLVVLLILFSCSKKDQLQESINLIGCWNISDNINEKYYFSFCKDTVRYFTPIKSGSCVYEVFEGKLIIYDWYIFNIMHVKNADCIYLDNTNISFNLCKNKNIRISKLIV